MEVMIPETRYKVVDTETGEEALVKRGIPLQEIEKQMEELIEQGRELQP